MDFVTHLQFIPIRMHPLNLSREQELCSAVGITGHCHTFRRSLRAQDRGGRLIDDLDLWLGSGTQAIVYSQR